MLVTATNTPRNNFISEARRVLHLAGPLVVGQFAIMAIGVSDVIIAGHYGTKDMAGVTIGYYLWDLSMLVVFGIMLANSALIGHRFGAADRDGIRRQFQQCLWLALPMSAVSGVAMYAAMRGIELMTIDAEVARVATGYLLPTIATSMLMPFMVCFRTTAEGLGLAKPVMWLNIGAFALNLPLNVVLVNGMFGLPRMGGAGCGWASLIAVSALVFSWFAYTLFAPALREYQLWARFGAPIRTEINAILSLGVPIGIELLCVGGFFSIVPLLMASLGPTALAGHSVAITIDSLMLMVPLGIGQAMSVRVAHELGGNDPHAARQVCVTGMTLVMGITLVQVVLIVLLRDNITALFTSDSAVRSLGATLLLYAAAYRLFDSAQISACMTLRGYKDTRFASLINVIAYWLFGLPLCYFLGMGTQWNAPLGVAGFWGGMVATIVIAAVLVCWRLASTANKFRHGGPWITNANSTAT